MRTATKARLCLLTRHAGGIATIVLGLLAAAPRWAQSAQWTQRSVAGHVARSSHAMAFDSDRGVMVLFGGITGTTGSTLSGETWEWDGATWVRRSTTGPVPRDAHSMVYDAARHVTVLYGGIGGQNFEFG